MTEATTGGVLQIANKAVLKNFTKFTGKHLFKIVRIIEILKGYRDFIEK